MRKIINTSSVWNGKLRVKRSFSLSLSLSLSLILFHSKISFCLRFLSYTETSVVMTVSLVLPLATFFYLNLSLSTIYLFLSHCYSIKLFHSPHLSISLYLSILSLLLYHCSFIILFHHASFYLYFYLIVPLSPPSLSLSFSLSAFHCPSLNHSLTLSLHWYLSSFHGSFNLFTVLIPVETEGQ